MTQQCPLCLQSDLADGALKCHHCGSWLDKTQKYSEYEAFRRDMRKELSEDLDKQRASLETLIKRMQSLAALIVIVVAGVSAYFGFRTDTSITETSSRIERQAGVEIEEAVADAKRQAVTEAERVVLREMQQPEMQNRIAERIEISLDRSVAVEVQKRVDALKDEVETEVVDAKQELDAAVAAFDVIKLQSGKLSEEFSVFNARLETAQRKEVGALASLLPVEPVETSEKGGLWILDELIDRRINAVSYTLERQGYSGPAAWVYLTRLRRMPEFRYLVLLAPGEENVIGIYDADLLALALDPPDTRTRAEEAESYGWELPPPESVEDWSRFVEWVMSGAVEKLAALPSFQPVGAPVPLNATSLTALDMMERQGADILPVVDEGGRFVGVVERSRLTTRMLLEIAEGGSN